MNNNSDFFTITALTLVVLLNLMEQSHTIELLHYLSKDEFVSAERLSITEIEKSIGTLNETDDDPILMNSTMYGDVLSMPQYSSVQPQRLWPGGIVYYSIDGSVSRKERTLLAKSFSEIEKNTCIKFRPRMFEGGFVKFKSYRNAGCYSSTLGRSGGYQEVNLEPGVFGWSQCWTFGVVTHEIFHVLGLYHEQARNDRDQYIKVFFNIITCPSQFHKGYFQQKLVGNFDYGSIMSYKTTDCSLTGQPVMRALKPPVYTNTMKMGQRVGPTTEDYRKIRIMYDCPSGKRKKVQKPSEKTKPERDCPMIATCGHKESCAVKTCAMLLGACRCLMFGRTNF